MPTASEPEKRFRKLLTDRGLKFICNDSTLLGTPDIVFPRESLIVFIHGCFWHHHQNCPGNNYPVTGVAKWLAQANAQVIRDKNVNTELQRQGWKVLIFWVCEVNSTPDSLIDKLIKELDSVCLLKLKS